MTKEHRPTELGIVNDGGLDAIETPALVLDLEAFERNLAAMKQRIEASGLALRAHAKSHKSIDVARAQVERGGAIGLCAQTLAEAEMLIAGGIEDVLITNQLASLSKIARLAELACRAEVKICADDPENVDALNAAAGAAGARLGVLVEIDVGGARCGVRPGADALALAARIRAAPHLRFCGLQAYHGQAQHMALAERRAAIEAAARVTRHTVALLAENGLPCPIVGGGGTGGFEFEVAAGVWTELQCGSYVFMDRHYLDVLGEGVFEPALFVLAEVISIAVRNRAVCDAGLKAIAFDSGPPRLARINGEPANPREILGRSDEHTIVDNRDGALGTGDRLWLIPGHCDPTAHLHDEIVFARGAVIEGTGVIG